MFIDIHTHLAPGQHPGNVAINNVLAGESGIEAPLVYNSLGLHPWQLNTETAKELEKKFIKGLHMPNLIALGEAGLDKAIAADFKLQQTIFEMQADLAAEMAYPLIIHAVRSYNELLQVHKRMKKKLPWIVHGFRGNAQQAVQLSRTGIMISFGSALLHHEGKLADALIHTPKDMLFLETDDSGLPVEDIYIRAAQILQIGVGELKAQLIINFERCFPYVDLQA